MTQALVGRTRDAVGLTPNRAVLIVRSTLQSRKEMIGQDLDIRRVTMIIHCRGEIASKTDVRKTAAGVVTATANDTAAQLIAITVAASASTTATRSSTSRRSSERDRCRRCDRRVAVVPIVTALDVACERRPRVASSCGVLVCCCRKLLWIVFATWASNFLGVHASTVAALVFFGFFLDEAFVFVSSHFASCFSEWR